MPVEPSGEPGRRSLVPRQAGRSLWLAAAWTGAGAAVACATVALVLVAICWLPVSGAGGRSHSAIHAGLLTFLAGLHGGVTVDGSFAMFLPLGMMIAVGLTAWRAGSGLADAAGVLGEQDPLRLALAAAAQAGTFMCVCLFAVPFATLGTSSAPFLGVGTAALLLFLATGGVSFARSSPLRDWLAARLPERSGSWARAAAAAVTVYLGAGAVLMAGSLVVHHDRVEELSGQVGTGWGGIPVLLLGVLAAPNAAIAAAAYLAGPGFTVGAGTTASVASTAHGTLPAFPILGAVPSGHGPTTVVWLLVIATPLAAGFTSARRAARQESWAERLRDAGATAVLAGLVMLVLAWQGGGAVGDGRLRVVGASPLWLWIAVTLEVGVVAAAGLGLAAGWRAWSAVRFAAAVRLADVRKPRALAEIPSEVPAPEVATPDVGTAAPVNALTDTAPLLRVVAEGSSGAQSADGTDQLAG
jgi:hypothetical protein